MCVYAEDTAQRQTDYETLQECPYLRIALRGTLIHTWYIQNGIYKSLYHTILIWCACTPWLRKSLNLAQTAEVICWIQASKRCHAPATPAALAGIVDIASDTAAQEVEVHTDAVGDGAWPRRRTALKNGIPNLNWFSSNSWWQSWGKSYVQTIVLRCTE